VSRHIGYGFAALTLKPSQLSAQRPLRRLRLPQRTVDFLTEGKRSSIGGQDTAKFEHGNEREQMVWGVS
jgi:hypothetical protein